MSRTAAVVALGMLLFWTLPPSWAAPADPSGPGSLLLQWGDQPEDEDTPFDGEEAPTRPGVSILQDQPEDPSARPRTPPARPLSLSLYALQVLVPLSGAVGAGSGAPSYGEAFGPGMGAGLSAGYRILPGLEGRVELGFTQFSSAPFDLETPTGPEKNQLDDYTVMIVAVGPRFSFLLDRPAAGWFAPGPGAAPSGFFPFAQIQFGLAYTGEVGWPTPAPSWAFWDAGITSFLEFSAGAEFRFLDFLGAFAELGLAVLGPPAPASLGIYSGMNEAGSLTAFRLAVGLTAAF